MRAVHKMRGRELFLLNHSEKQNSKGGCDRGDRSRRVRQTRLIQACRIANRNPAIRVAERDWDALTDEIVEPWDDVASE